MGVMGLLKKAVIGIVTIGVVFGLWRVLGKGAGITDPMFYTNAAQTAREVQAWGVALVKRFLK